MKLFALFFVTLLLGCHAMAAQLSFEAPTQASHAKGSPIEIKIRLKNVPRKSSVSLSLVKDIPEKDRFKVPGPEGVLMTKAIPVGAVDTITFTWDGLSFGCAPDDGPTLCKTPAEPGFYFLHAELYEHPAAPLIEGFVARPTVLKKLAEARSIRLQITGEPDLTPVKTTLRGTAINRLQTDLSLPGFSGTNFEIYVEEKNDFSGPNPQGLYCQTFSYRPPFSGKLNVCAPNEHSSDRVRTQGGPRSAPGLLSFKDASEKALSLAEKPYLKRVRFRHQPSLDDLKVHPEADFHEWSRKNPDASTYLSTVISNWTYRAESSQWIFVIFAGKAGGEETGSDRFSDHVVVLISHQGTACTWKTVPYRGGDYGDIFKDKYVCP